MQRIAIVGAGISGLACAQRLSESGASVVIFEKSRSLGGRCASRAWEGCIIDHGAQFFTARSPEFQNCVEKLGPAIREIDAPVIDEHGQPVAPDSSRLYHVEGNNRLGRELSDGLDVRRETLVEQITDRRIAGENFDAVVTCAPWPQTAAMLGLDPGKSPYERNLTAAFLYDSAWSGQAREVYAVSDRSGSALAWSACENHKINRVPEGRILFVVQASGGFSAEHYDAPREEWAGRLQAELETTWELTAARRKGIFTHRWGFARRVSDLGVIALPEGVFVCGDARCESRIEDVWASGRAVASELLGRSRH